VASDDGYLRLLDSKTLKPIASYGKHNPGVLYSAAFSPDQTRLLTVGSEGSARIWSLGPPADGERTLTAQLPEWEAPGGRGRQPGMLVQQTFSPDSKLIAASGTDRTVRVWSTTTGKLARELRENGQNALVTFSPDGRRLATSGGERFVKIWDVATGREALKLESRNSNFVRIAFHPSGRVIAAGMAILFCSGVSDMTHATLDGQFPTIVGRLSETLSAGGGSWQRVARASFFLHREESLNKLRETFRTRSHLRRCRATAAMAAVPGLAPAYSDGQTEIGGVVHRRREAVPATARGAAAAAPCALSRLNFMPSVAARCGYRASAISSPGDIASWRRRR
jgi:hypothetical protein